MGSMDALLKGDATSFSGCSYWTWNCTNVACSSVDVFQKHWIAIRCESATSSGTNAMMGRIRTTLSLRVFHAVTTSSTPYLDFIVRLEQPLPPNLYAAQSSHQCKDRNKSTQLGSGPETNEALANLSHIQRTCLVRRLTAQVGPLAQAPITPFCIRLSASPPSQCLQRIQLTVIQGQCLFACLGRHAATGVGGHDIVARVGR